MSDALFSLISPFNIFAGCSRTQVREPLLPHATRNRDLGVVLVMVYRQHNWLAVIDAVGQNRTKCTALILVS
jgi:hypothetical protein